MKQYLTDLADYLTKKGNQYNDNGLLETAKGARERAEKIKDFVTSSETNNDEEEPPTGGDHPKKRPGDP
jgi:hypothetical protein